VCAYASKQNDDARTIRTCDESLRLSHEFGFRIGIFSSAFYRGSVARNPAELVVSRTLLEESLIICRAIGYAAFTTWVLAGVSRICLAQEDMPAARAYAVEGAELGQSIGDKWGTALALRTLARLAIDAGDDLEAIARLQASLRLVWDAGMKQDMLESLELLARALTRIAPEYAAQLLGAVTALRESLAVITFEQRQPGSDEGAQNVLARVLGPTAFIGAFNAGQRLTLPEAANLTLLEAIPNALQPRSVNPENLTNRELEILQLIAAGKPNREISADLFLSVRTVERHIANLYGKLGVHSKAEATAYAFRHQLVADHTT
jgi:DNA-binding CsgD family transcriptional regulator